MIKFNCINTQHADIAVKQFNAINVKSIVTGRAVLAECEWDNPAIKIMSGAMGYSVSDISNEDVELLESVK